MESLKYEEALKQLEEIVEKLESGDLDLQESINAFEKGIKLAVFCQEELRKADGKISKLIKNIEGELELIEFE